MEFRSTNEKGAAIKTAAPLIRILWLLTSGCQELSLTVVPLDASDRPDRRNLDGSRDGHASRDDHPSVVLAAPIDRGRANPDRDELDLVPNLAPNLAPNLDYRGVVPISGRHSSDCHC